MSAQVAEVDTLMKDVAYPVDLHVYDVEKRYKPSKHYVGNSLYVDNSI